MSKTPPIPIRKLTVPEVAALNGVSTEVVRRWIASGELRATDASAKRNSRKPRWRISQADLAEFEQRRANKTDSLPRVRRAKPGLQGVTKYF